VHAGRRQLQGRQHGVDLRDRTAADDGQASAQLVAQRGQRLHQAGRHHHRIGRVGQVDQRAVEVEEQAAIGPVGQQERRVVAIGGMVVLGAVALRGRVGIHH
jgi:hypothetical protein